ncbi:hypothetical protein ABEB36_007704 [Hypothenemus hampei]|uniref:Set2 Rpb1 interacting domain-containing protein n=1 Tax=Hypothenemus hampei TaxID=57062 RepID=A0ABD1EVD8_HYPHA
MSNTTDKKSLFGESDEESVRKDQDSDEKRRHKDRKRDKKHNQDRERSSERKKHHKDRSEKRRHSSDKNNERDEDRKRRKRHENESDIYLGDIVRKERLSQENGANKQNLNETLGLTSENGNSAQSNNKDSDEIALNNKNSAGNQREDLTNALTETHNNDGEEIDNLQQSPKLVIDTKGERNVQQQNNTDISNANSNKPKLKKKEVGLLVVKLLTPAYIDKRFESREIFKAMARKISHHLANKDEEEIKDYVKRFLNRNLEITSKTSI